MKLMELLQSPHYLAFSAASLHLSPLHIRASSTAHSLHLDRVVDRAPDIARQVSSEQHLRPFSLLPSIRLNSKFPFPVSSVVCQTNPVLPVSSCYSRRRRELANGCGRRQFCCSAGIGFTDDDAMTAPLYEEQTETSSDERSEAFEEWLVAKIREDGPLALRIAEELRGKDFPDIHSVDQNIIRTALHTWRTNNGRVGNLSPLLGSKTIGRIARSSSSQFAAQVSTSSAPQRRYRDLSESEGCDSSDSDEDRYPKRPKEGSRVWEPHVVEFPCYAAKEEEKFFHELLAFPWQRGRTERFIERLEKKYFPKHGLDSMLKPSYRKKAAEKFAVNAVPESKGFPDDRFHEPLDYPTLAKALSTGLSSQDNFRSQRSNSGSTRIRAESGLDSSPGCDAPSIRTIRAPLNRDGLGGLSAVTDNKGGIQLSETCGEAQSSEKLEELDHVHKASNSPTLGDAGITSAVSRAQDTSNLQGDSDKNPQGVASLVSILPKRPPVLKRNTKLPENWNVAGGTVVLMDKPKGWTSFAVCAKIRRLVNVKKVGHAGTLDPLATGLLVVCVGQATKLADSYQALSKVYTGTLRLGEGTPSSCSESPVNERKSWEHITDGDIQIAKEAFVGDIMQIPPMFSAIKVQGERLYEKARRGEHLDIPARRISVYEFGLERNKENRQDLDFRVCCSKGTYVRSLCADLGRALNCCAHMTSLRREKIGDLSVNDAWDYIELEDTYNKLYR